MNEPPDPGLPSYQTIKTSLKRVARNDVIIEKLQAATKRANAIMTHGLQFLKLYLLHCYENDLPFPKLTKAFVNTVLKVSCDDPKQGKPPSEETVRVKAVLREVYDKHYANNGKVPYIHLNTAIDYMATEVITMYENNIKAHFVEYVERFVNVSWGKKDALAAIKASDVSSAEKNSLKYSLCAQLRKVKIDLLSPGEKLTSEKTYHDWIEAQRAHVMPQRKLNKGVRYDIHCSPQDYLPKMLYMMRAVEARGFKINSVFPLRSDVIPKHFRMDTTTLVYLCMTKDIGTQSYYPTKGNLVRYQPQIWDFFFKTHLKCFHLGEHDDHSYTFDHMVETDGVSISILLVRKELIGKNVRKPKPGPPPPELYIDELSDYSEVAKKKLVAIDPNMSDLLYCQDGERNIYRYTQDTRRKETYVKKHRDYLQTRKREMVDGKRVVEWEAELSVYNKKTTDFERFKAYVAKKNEMNVRLAPFYDEHMFRRMKMLSYIGRQRTEAKMLREFEAKFGSGDEAVIAIGDWEQRQHRKFKEPIKGKGFRTLLRKAGYDVYLVDEFRTSCRCSACEEHGECTTFRECDNPRPYRDGRILRHGLVRCKTCQRLWNRDTNASSNIYAVASNAIHGMERPEHLKRAEGSVRPATSAGSDARSGGRKTTSKHFTRHEQESTFPFSGKGT